jgi:outer membrane protein OmpA-like peptidoglycan-associated protein
MKKIFVLLLLLTGTGLFASAQLGNILKRAEQRAKDRVKQKVDQKVDEGVDRAVDKADPTSPQNKSKKKKNDDGGGDAGDAGGDNGGGGGNVSGGKKGTPTLKTYSKYDFVPGEKVVAVEDFAQDAVGDFPAKWNTNSTGEVQTIEGRSGKWLSVSKDGVFLPEFITSLPENFTLEFDLICSDNFSFYSTAFNVAMAALKNPGKDFTNWKQHSGGRTGVQFWLHPQDAGGGKGHTGFSVFNPDGESMKNETATVQFHSKTPSRTQVHISVWRQKQRLRVYINEEKVWDVPRAFDAAIKYNSIVFSIAGFHNNEDRYLFSNVRLAVGAPDTRSKLITEGKYVTRGITFDVNSDKIKPESYGTLKDIAAVLTENADVRVKIIGHTDSDGDDKSNMELSKRRAESVKAMLSKEFGIDASRMETDGKGESQPADKNTSPEGKANNRRVEFIKL